MCSQLGTVVNPTMNLSADLNTALGDRYLVIYDGVCVLCNAIVNFIIKRDPNSQFVFTPTDSHLANTIFERYEINQAAIDSVVLFKNDQVFTHSTAALEVCKDLSGYWRWLSYLTGVPPIIRDFVYRMVARHRYRLFGRYQQCLVPDQKILNRFIDLPSG